MRDAPDETVRTEIRRALDRDLFVEAGAGSGKTTALVERVLALVCDAGVPMARIAAITFTEKAAGELRDRIRRELERTALDEATDAERRDRAAIALDEVDGAAVSTLHAFAQRLLGDCPIEAGLPPRFDVHDELASQVAFDDRWSDFVESLLDDPEYARTVLLGRIAGVTFPKLRELAVQAGASWDLVERERVHEHVTPPPALDAQPLLDAIDAVSREAHRCADDGDRLLERIREIDDFATRLRAARDELDAFEVIVDDPASLRSSRRGRAASWDGDLGALREQVDALEEHRDRVRGDVAEAVARHLVGAIARFTLESAARRERAGTLEFHDLLVLARRMLRDPVHGGDVRTRLRARYERVLLDEFQDTDPIQLDLAVLLAAADPAAGAHDWTDVVTEPGRLFVVGDPKQSIYRFRRADIGLFLQARDRLVDRPLRLTASFRTVPAVTAWINHTFSRLIEATPGAQPEYVALDAVRAPAPGGPGVVLVGVDAHEPGRNADELRAAEAADVARAIHTAIAEGWPVSDDPGDGSGPRWRAARLGDVAVLLPARTSLGHLEDALVAGGIPYRAETSSLVYSTREIRDLLVALRAVDDPTDELAVVTSLRSALFGCGDDDLFEYYVRHGGRWHPFAPAPATLTPDHPVVEAMGCLREWSERKHWLAASELVDLMVRERRVLEVAYTSGRPRDVWRRVRYLVDQARAYAESEGGTLREFLEWAERQGDEGSRVVETVLPESDDDAVRILTIHGAKGLEFPITILSGMTTRAMRRASGARLVFPPGGGWAVRVDARIQTEEYQRFEPIDEQMGFHEKLRLLYVGATRARDHLVVSLHRPDKDPGDDPTSWTHAQLLRHGSDGAHATTLPVGDTAAHPRASALPEPVADAPSWREERDRALREARIPRTQSATRLATEASTEASTVGDADTDPGLAKEPRHLELPPWQRGRYGTAIGRAVHAVLQTIDLRTGEGIEAASAAQAAAEGVLGHEPRIVALARVALATDTVREAVASEHRRETYVATTIGDRTIEGYVDLLYRTPEGIVVVDYKTDAIGSDADVDAKLERYRLQGAAYALAVGAATGERVARCVFLFLDPAGARERVLSDLEGAVAQVGDLLTRT